MQIAEIARNLKRFVKFIFVHELLYVNGLWAVTTVLAQNFGKKVRNLKLKKGYLCYKGDTVHQFVYLWIDFTLGQLFKRRVYIHSLGISNQWRLLCYTGKRRNKRGGKLRERRWCSTRERNFITEKLLRTGSSFLFCYSERLAKLVKQFALHARLNWF